MRTPRLPVVDWTDAPADLNGLVRFAERRKSCFCTSANTFQLAFVTVYNSVPQVPELAARVENNKQYNIRLLGVPSLVRLSFAAKSLCIASQLALSESFLLSFASNSGKNAMKTKKTKRGFTALWHVNQKSGPLSRVGEAVRSNITSTVVTYFLTARNVFIGNSFLQATRLISIITGRCCIVWSSKHTKNTRKDGGNKIDWFTTTIMLGHAALYVKKFFAA